MENSSQFLTLLRKWIEVSMHRSMHGFIQNEKESGLTMPQLRTMFKLQHRGSCGVREIGKDLGVTSAASSQMIDRMVQQGYLVRSEAPHDRRVKEIDLTDKGREAIRESVRAQQKWLDDLAALLSPEEQEQVLNAINILIEKAKLLEQIPHVGASAGK